MNAVYALKMGAAAGHAKKVDMGVRGGIMGKQKRNDSILFSVVQALGEDST